ncbi:MAG: aspartate/glutamate racemase family protein [Synergistales bacterium]|nr:aspartate/glutamate racemase family protein [Synergistales bacterium]
MTSTPLLGVLCWEEGASPRGLQQLESLKGNSTNPATYPFPVRFAHVPGANLDTILRNPDRAVHRRMIDTAGELVREGVRFLTTSCGFNVLLQGELARAVPVPAATSSLLQAPAATRLCGGSVAVITAHGPSLTGEHLRAAGITDEVDHHVHGMERCPEWNTIFTAPDREIDLDVVGGEVVAVARSAMETHPHTGAFVLECTDLPPFAERIRAATGLPVFDYTTMVRSIADALGIAATDR